MVALVAVADPDPLTRGETARTLTAAGFDVLEAGDGVHALRQVFTHQPEAIVMALHLPMLGGVELVRVLRAASDIVIAVVAEQLTPSLTARLLDTGADQVMLASVAPVELTPRVRASLRRADTGAPPVTEFDEQVIRTGPLAIDREARAVTLHGTAVSLTRTEHRLLDALARHIGQLCPHHYLLAAAWGNEYVEDTHYLRGYIASLRRKLEDDPAHPRLLLTEWGTGYRLAALPAERGVAGATLQALAATGPDRRRVIARDPRRGRATLQIVGPRPTGTTHGPRFGGASNTTPRTEQTHVPDARAETRGDDASANAERDPAHGDMASGPGSEVGRSGDPRRWPVSTDAPHGGEPTSNTERAGTPDVRGDAFRDTQCGAMG